MVNACGQPQTSRGSELARLLLFQPETPLDTKFSKNVIIVPGMAYLFTVHNMPSNSKIFTNWVIKGRDTEGNPATMFWKKMALGGTDRWIFTPVRPQKIITLPGNYIFELGNDDMLGRNPGMVMEAVSWRLSDCPIGGLVVS
ncbi:MAG: hypothetical protein LBQ12_14155 [Deltaproteobacteria bacterium]|nr:hypothetical protein [Deltaproteobacteria bacterium]